MVLVCLMLMQTTSASVGFEEYAGHVDERTDLENPDPYLPPFQDEIEPWVDPSLIDDLERTNGKSRVTVITKSLQNLEYWQLENGALEVQAEASKGEVLIQQETTDGVIDHRTFWVSSQLVQKNLWNRRSHSGYRRTEST